MSTLLQTAGSVLCPLKHPPTEALMVPSARAPRLQPQAQGTLSQSQQLFNISTCITRREVSGGNAVLMMHLWCEDKKKTKLNWLKARVVVTVGLSFFFFPWTKTEANLRNSFTQESWSKLGKHSNLVFFFFPSPKCPFLKCVHHIFIYFLFQRIKQTRRVSAWGWANLRLARNYGVLLFSIQFFWGQQHNHLASIKKNACNSLLICGLIDPPCFPTSLFCCTVEPLCFQGLCLQAYNCCRIRGASVSRCLRQWLSVPSDSNTLFVPSIVPCTPSISPANTTRVFLFSSLHNVVT